VYHRTGPFIYYTDQNRDGLLDVGGVFVAANGKVPVPDLTVMDRLYNAEAEPYDFFYQCFIQENGTIKKADTLNLGKRTVIQGMNEISIKTDPFGISALSVVFPTAEGTEDEWIIFSETRVSRLSLKENFSTYPAVYDLDEDDVLDIVVFAKTFEEGVGVETFATWYKWDGKRFSEYKTINIVRNLNRFLNRARELLIQNDIEAFFSYGLRSQDAESIRRKNPEKSAALFQVFTLLAQESSGDEIASAKDLVIYDVTFPEILENPFLQISFRNYSFSPIIKLTTSAGAYFFIATIRMFPNPFITKEQFYFLPK